MDMVCQWRPSVGKLWDKGYKLDSLIELFTVGEDYILDTALVPADCVASMAHARMLAAVGILSDAEYRDIHLELGRIIEDVKTGTFRIRREDEDCHTAIENRLTEVLGETGKKVHTGRSRNDQVLAALRLYAKSYLFDFMESVLTLSGEFLHFARVHRDVPMPGRTHLQAGMPSSLGLWAGAYGEDLLDSYTLLETAFQLNDQCPLGSAASYGVPLPLDRELTAKLLGFSKVQNNVLYVQNSRGKIETALLQGIDMVLMGLSKAAWDIILFSLPEFGYFSLPKEICSGSSIMPQKRNPDVLELVRSKSAVVAGYVEQVKNIIRPLYSGYNRDFQDTKGPLLRGFDIGYLSVAAMLVTVKRMNVHPEKLRDGFSPDIFATDSVLDLVRDGKSFRDAYMQVARDVDGVSPGDPDEAIQKRRSSGTPGNLRLDEKVQALKALKKSLLSRKQEFAEAITGLVGFKVDLHCPPGG